MMELLKQEAQARLGITLTPTQLEQFQLYYEQLGEWNSRFNLTAITEAEGVQIRHFLDSLTLGVPKLLGNITINFAKASLIDIGSGAGFPGLPLKILYPSLRLTMTDSVAKKATFLTHMVQTLSLEGVTVLTQRAEELGQDPVHRQKYTIATGRAVANLAVLAEYCLPLCKVGGYFIAPKKGDKVPSEIEQAQNAFKKLGGKLHSADRFDLPGDSPNERCLIVVQKVGSTPSVYPRRIGLPSQSPL